MSAITVPLSEEQLDQLRTLAEGAGLAPEELVRAGVEEWLSRPRPDFRTAIEYVLRKNAELYRRLA
jgi:antitoxin FitA